MYKRLLVLVVLAMVAGCAGQNIKTTSEYDDVWLLKMYTGNTYLHTEVPVVNGRFDKKLSRSSRLKGYISADGEFSAYYTFIHGGWNHGAFHFSLDRERSTATRLVGKWSGMDGAYIKNKKGDEYGGGRWEAIKK